jgi:c-di-GMP-binding flagellar brake protein YcgR
LYEPLKLWERIEIVVGEGTDSGRYVARIEDFSEGGIIITRPDFVDGSALLQKNCDVIVLITKEDAVYQFHSRIKQIKTVSGIIHLLTFPKKLRRVQRRQFVRIELYTNVLYTNLSADKPDTNEGNRFKWKQYKGINISAGGILMTVKKGLKRQDLLLLKIALFEECGLSEMIAGICRRIVIKGNEFFVGVKFIRSDQLVHHFNQEGLMTLPQSVKDFDRSAQNKLAAYIFYQQIELRKKGLL